MACIHRHMHILRLHLNAAVCASIRSTSTMHGHHLHCEESWLLLIGWQNIWLTWSSSEDSDRTEDCNTEATEAEHDGDDKGEDYQN